MKPLLLLLLISVSLYCYEFNSLPDNTARITDLQRTQLSTNGQVSIDSSAFQLLDVSLSVPLGLYKTAGIEVNHLWDQYGESGTSVKAAFAIKPWKQLSVGGTLGYRYSSDTGEKHTVPIDLGVEYEFYTSPVIGDMLLGISAQNITGISPDSLKILTEPRAIKLDWSASFLSRGIRIRTELGADIDNRSTIYEIDFLLSPPLIEIGYTFNHNEWLIYGGYRPSESISLYVRGGWGQDRNHNNVVRFSVDKEFGRSREEKLVRKEQMMSIFGPGKLYNEMRQNFSDKNYWVAMSLCGKIIGEYPDFFKNDWVCYFLASSLEQLGFRNEALHMIDSCLQYRESPASNRAILLLHSIYLHDNDSKIRDSYNRLGNLNVSDSLLFASEIAMGEYYLKNGRTTPASVYYNKVPPNFALYKDAQRGLVMCKKLKESDETFSIKDSVLIKKYGEVRKRNDKRGNELLKLILSPASRFVKERYVELEREAQSDYLIVQEYEQAWENERVRLGGNL